MTEDFGRPAQRSALTFVTILVASSLVALIGFLLFDNYQTTASLQRTLLERMHQETARRVVSLDSFFGERRSDLAHLTRSREVRVFFENRALGMSLRYGLKQSLIPIKQLFDGLTGRKRIAGEPVFDRLVLVDETGEILVDTNLDGITIGAGKLPACNRPQDKGGAILTQDDGRSLVVSMPYRFKDDYAAQIMGWIKPAVIYDHLLGIDGDAQALAYLLAEPAADGGLRLVGGGALNPWSKLLAQTEPELAAMPADAAARTRVAVPTSDIDVYVSTLQVPRTNFKLVELNRIEAVEGGLNPWGQVLGVGALALLVLSGIAFVFRANVKFATLEARLSEAALREQQIQAKNAALKVEVAERRRAEAALIDSEREFRAIANYTYDWEDWTDPNDRLLWVNPAVERVSGYSVDDCMAMSDYPLPMVHPEDRDGFSERFRTTGDKHGTDLEFRLLHKDGRTSWVAISWQPIFDADGVNLGRRSSIHDVTERRRAIEAMQEAKDAAEAASKAKSDFLANMSHEIRTPMVGVIGMTGLLCDTHLSEQQKDYVDTIRSSGDALLEVINDILDFSKIEANRMELEVTGFDLRTTIEEAADILSLRAFEKGLNFNCLLPEGIPMRLRGDSGRLRQVLVNLTGNAIKFTEHGEVSVDVKRLDQEASHTRCLLRFAVNDTGIGIPADRRNRLFESFFQVDTSTTRRFGGTGLGLAISKQLVELMGGHIGCISNEGKGSTFWFEIPFEIDAHVPEPIDESAQVLKQMSWSARDAQPDGDDAAESRAPLRVLVAEDNPTNQKVALSMLKRLGYHADAVGNGSEALNALKLLPYDLVLMDVQMPEMDGLEATRRFRALEAGTGRHLPILAMTAHASLYDRERCFEAGMDDFITKPVQRDVLGKTISTNLNKFQTETPMPATSEPSHFDPPSRTEFTVDIMIERLDNDEEIAREIAEIFVSSSEELLAELASAVTAGQADVVRARAHSIKGSSGNIGAEAVQDLAAAMEDAGRDGDLDQAKRLLAPLRNSLEQVNQVLSNWS